jgi:hypothetical protein
LSSQQLGAFEIEVMVLDLAEQEATLNALAVEAFNDLLKKHGKRANVENPLLD